MGQCPFLGAARCPGSLWGCPGLIWAEQSQIWDLGSGSSPRCEVSLSMFCFHVGPAASALPFTVQLSAKSQRTFAIPILFFFFFPLFSTSPLFEMSVTNKIKYLFFLFQNFLFPGCGHSVSLCSSFQGKNFAPSRWILAGVWIWVPILPLQPSQGGSLFYLFLGKSHSRGIPSWNCIFSVPATKGRELMFSPHSGSSPC